MGNRFKSIYVIIGSMAPIMKKNIRAGGFVRRHRSCNRRKKFVRLRDMNS